MSAPSILLVDDEPSVLHYTKTLLEVDNYRVETAASGEEAVQRIQRRPAPNLIVLDLVMPGMDGLQTLENCKKIRPEQKILMMSCLNDTSKVVQAIKLGAGDYLQKPFQAQQLQGAVRRILDFNPKSHQATEYTVKDTPVIENLDDDLFFLAASPVMKQIHAQVALIARVDVSVLILGESGVGKEILARLIHRMSIRAQRPMVKVNCAALPAELVESELFGYEAGAFTGATSSKPGKFELADSGTILLDEIGEMSAALQAKLLHVLQDGRFSRLGGGTTLSVDARVLAATNVDVQKAIAERKLREDLYYRLNAFTMTIPPLRERREEIPLLLTYYMNNLAAKFGKNPLPLSDRLVRECLRYHWPGNLRELGNIVKRYLVLEDENLLVDGLQRKIKAIGAEEPITELPSSAGRGGLKALLRSLKGDAETKEIQGALEDASWNRKLAAAQLGISYKALLYKVKQYGLSAPDEHSGNAGGHGGDSAPSSSLLFSPLDPRGLIANRTRFSRQQITLFTPFTSPLDSAKVSLVANGRPRVGENYNKVTERTMLEPKNQKSPLPKRRKVLLVGAEPSVQSLMSTFLLTMGWTCTVVQNQEETPAILQREAFDAVVIDPGRSEVDAEQTVLTIKQIRPSLGDRMIAINNRNTDHKMLELMERHDLIQVSQEGLLPKLWATLQELVVSPRSRELVQRGMPVARMIFDSFRHPLAAGVRSLASGTRQLAYQHKSTIIDLSLELADGSGRMSLAGQVLDGERKGKNEGLPVLLVSGSGTLARTATNKFGEFQVECDFPEDVSLEIRLGERSWVLVPLGKMDWAVKPTASWQTPAN